MKLYKKLILFISILFFSAKAFSQTTAADSTQNNFMYENGKIYVVVVVAAVIVLGLFIYLMNLDRRISKLEKRKQE